MVLFGGSSGAVPPFDLITLSQKGSLYVTRPTLANYIATREELVARSGAVFGMIAAGKLKLRIEHTVSVGGSAAGASRSGRTEDNGEVAADAVGFVAPGPSRLLRRASRPPLAVVRDAHATAGRAGRYSCRALVFSGTKENHESNSRAAYGRA